MVDHKLKKLHLVKVLMDLFVSEINLLTQTLEVPCRFLAEKLPSIYDGRRTDTSAGFLLGQKFGLCYTHHHQCLS